MTKSVLCDRCSIKTRCYIKYKNLNICAKCDFINIFTKDYVILD